MHITGGKFNSRKLISPKGENVRPTLSKTRAAIFDVLYQFMDFGGKSFLDLFAGSGIMGLEAISRGFEKCTAIERDKKTFLNIKENYELLGVSPNVILGDSIKKMKSLDEQYDVIYIDPPYSANLYNPVIAAIIENKLLKKNGIAIFEYTLNEEINITGLEVLKQKSYGNKIIMFCKIVNNDY